MDDPLEWLPQFLKDHWDQSVESLRSDGEDITASRTEIWPAHDRRSGGNLLGLVRLKVFEAGDLTYTRMTHGDLDRDAEQRFNIDLQAKDPGDQARRRVHECAQVVVRILELHRSNPHPDWNRIEAIRETTVNNYPDYQQRVIGLTLRRFGKIMPLRIPVTSA